MTTLILILSSLVLWSAVFFIYALWSYILAKKKAEQEPEDKDEVEPQSDEASVVEEQESVTDTSKAVLALIEQQQGIVEELISVCPERDQLRFSMLECWSLFLSLEFKLISKQITSAEAISELEKFIPLTQEAGFSQMMEVLVKKISAQRSLSQAINKDIERKNQLLQAKMNVNSELNEKFSRMKAELDAEHEIDESLSEMRIELAQAYQLENTIKTKLTAIKEAPEEVSEEYQLALELFLNSSELDDFIVPIQNEFDGKIEELKSIAEYQAKTIRDLKALLKDSAGKGADKFDVEYDIVVARLEKSLSDKKHILSRLELKLDSLQMVKYQLTNDAKTQERLVNERNYELELLSQNGGELANMQNIFSQKEDSLNNMTKHLDAAPLTGESQAYASELTDKVSAFKAMMNESELFVEMLELDLDAEQKKSAELQTRLAELSDYVMQQSLRVDAVNHQDSAQLEEANAELALEISTMKKEYERSRSSDESVSLQKKITELDTKIERMKMEYAQMEDQFLSSLL